MSTIIRFDHLKRKAQDEYLGRFYYNYPHGGACPKELAGQYLALFEAMAEFNAYRNQVERPPGFTINADGSLEVEVKEDIAPPRSVQQVMEEWKKFGLALIDNWDIRCVMKLVELFPSCLPQWLHGRRPTLDYNEKGDWCLIFEATWREAGPA